jgi:formate/nitrite transporter FocA (FNT family)
MLLGGIIALVLVATAFLHLCFCSVEHEDFYGSNHHCLLCTIFSFAVVVVFLSDLFTSLPVVHSPLLLRPIFSGNPSVRASVPARAPPSKVLS